MAGRARDIVRFAKLYSWPPSEYYYSQRAMSSGSIVARSKLRPSHRKQAEVKAQLLHRLVELVRFRQAVREPAGVGAVAAPVGEVLPAHALVAAGGILPGEPGLGLEGRDIGQRGAGVFLQPYAAAARHLRHLVEPKDHHLVVGADYRDLVAHHAGDRARLVRHLDIQDLLALAGVAD